MFLSPDLENWSEDEVRNENLSHPFDFNRAWARQMQEGSRNTWTNWQ